MEKSKDAASEYDELVKQIEWVNVPNADFDVFETGFERFKRRMARNPLVPLGFTLTVAVLALGVRNFYLGNKAMSQTLMRWRVGLQGATILSLVGGVMYEGWRNKE